MRSANRTGDFAKRLLDLYFSAVGLLLLAPFLVVAAVLVKFGDGGPVFYRGVRVGLHGRRFRIFKFRTMVVDADKGRGTTTTTSDDARITRVGRFLRRGKLDELPQLLNVLLGDMSLVGPRPQVEWAVALYTPEERALLSVRPGITDYASIRFLHENEILKGSRDAEREYLQKIHPEKVRLGLKYVRTRSLRVDVKLILLTLSAIVGVDVTSLEGDGYTQITEQWHMPASPEQHSMAYARYRFAAQYVQGKRVLEVACGAGMGLPYLTARAEIVVGGDFTRHNLTEARLHLPPVQPLIQLDAQQIPVRNGAFDAVVLFEAIYYLRTPERFLEECRRVTGGKGIVLACLPNRNRAGFIPSPLSTRYFSVEELTALFSRHGFTSEIFGAYEVRGAGVIRSIARKLGLVPRSLAIKAVLKRLMYGRLRALGGIEEGMAETPEWVPLRQNTAGFKNLYVVARCG